MAVKHLLFALMAVLGLSNLTAMDGEDLSATVLPGPIATVSAEPMTVSTVKRSSLWAGNIPPSLQTFECGTTGNMLKDSLTIHHNDRALRENVDYQVDWDNSKIIFLPESGLKAGSQVCLDYRYRLRRIDSQVRLSDGSIRLLAGRPGLNRVRPPEPPAGAVLLANYFADYNGSVHRYPIRGPGRSRSIPGRIPRTLERIRSGQPVTIICWGDSVTAGGETDSAHQYPNVLRKMLAERFPNAKINLKVVAVPGSNTSNWLRPKLIPFKNADWKLVEEEKPDLIILEFVNDTWIEWKFLDTFYHEILSHCRQLNTELILITPHFTHPAMMKFKENKQIDTRPYTVFLRDFAEKKHLALADASWRWENLAAEGIPYVTLLANSINHPDADGHRIFAEEVMKCFDMKTESDK